MNFPSEKIEYSPQSMTLYGLFRSYLFGNLYGDEKDEYQKYIFSKIQRYIQEIKRSLPVNSHEDFEGYLEDNIKWLCEISFKEGDKDFLSLEDKNFSQQRAREVNNQILHKIIRQKISMLVSRKYKVFSDYQKCKAIIRGEIPYEEFQNKYKNIILRFCYRYSYTFGIEVNDMKQELEIVLWKCIQQYKGQNFSRFSTYLQQALKNKVKDMYRAKFADKRIIDLYTINYNEGEGDSYIGSIVENMIHQTLDVLSREEDSVNIDGGLVTFSGYQSSGLIEEVYPRNSHKKERKMPRNSMRTKSQEQDIDMDNPYEEIPL